MTSNLGSPQKILWNSAVERLPFKLSWFWFVLAGAGAFAFYSTQLLNHDSSWYLFATRKWLAGGVLYRDVMELNPPLAFFMTVPGLWLADLLGLSDSNGFQLWMVVIGIGSLILLDVVLRSSTISPWSRKAVLVGAALANFVVPMADFGQREHMMVMLSLPIWRCCHLRPLAKTCPLLKSCSLRWLGRWAWC